MKIKNSYLILLLAILIPTSTYSMLRKMENAIIDSAERLYERAEDLFKVKNEVLFETQKPVEIIQFPYNSNDTTFQQTHEIAKELIRKLAKQGLSFDNIQQSKLYFKKPKDAAEALKILNEMYSSLANKTTLHKWEDRMPEDKYKIFIEVKASSKKKPKKANL